MSNYTQLLCTRDEFEIMRSLTPEEWKHWRSMSNEEYRDAMDKRLAKKYEQCTYDYRKLIDDIEEYIEDKIQLALDTVIECVSPESGERGVIEFVKSVINDMHNNITHNAELIEQGKFREYLDSLEED